MLTNKELENIVACAMNKFAQEEHGAEGWNKADIRKMIEQLGGDENDLYTAMAIGMDICMGATEKPRYLFS
jgi:hypothetical protein